MIRNMNLCDALMQFRYQLSEEDVIYWNKAFAHLCILGIFSTHEYDDRIVHFQNDGEFAEHESNLPIVDKIYYMAHALENNPVALYYCLMFLFKFFLWVRKHCPTLALVISMSSDPLDVKAERNNLLMAIMWIDDDFLKKEGLTLLNPTCQQFLAIAFESGVVVKSRSLEEKVVTELKDQIVCAQIAYDDEVWGNLKYSPIDGDEEYEEVYT